MKTEPPPAPWAGNYASAPLPFSEHWLPKKGRRLWAAVGLTCGTPESSLFDSYPAFPGEIWWPQGGFARRPLLLQSHACGLVSSHLHLCVGSWVPEVGKRKREQEVDRTSDPLRCFHWLSLSFGSFSSPRLGLWMWLVFNECGEGTSRPPLTTGIQGSPQR